MTVEPTGVQFTFSLVALSETASISLSSYKETSLQEIPLWWKSISKWELKRI
jgi:hypothetical protein